MVYELTGQEADDGFEHGNDSVDDGHEDTSDGVDDCHDASADGLETRDDSTHVGGVFVLLLIGRLNELV